VARGYLQGGLLSPLLWSVAVDELIVGLSENGCYIQGSADDIALLIGGKFLNIVPEPFQEALCMVQQRRDRTQLSVHPQKMVMVPFTRKRDLRGLKETTLSGHKLQLSTEFKYLGTILDKGLTWKANLENVINKAYRAFWTCKGIFGKTLDLKSRV
jgi:hypothetical protein